MYSQVRTRSLLVLLAFSLSGAGAVPAAMDILSDASRDAVEAGQRRARVIRLQQDARQRPSAVLSFEIGQLSDSHAAAFLGQATNLSDADSRLKRLRLLAQYALASGTSADALDHASRYAELAQSDLEGSEAQYALARAELIAGRPREAYIRMDWLSRHGHGVWRGWGLYGQGQCALAEGDTAEAVRLLKSASTMGRHAAIAPAMLMLGHLYEASGQTQRAIRYLTMYREKFKRGIIPLLDHVSGDASQAEVLAEVTYTIQVGVYGDRGNAIRQRDLFESLGYRVRLKRKTMAGQRYTAVWVGKYRSQSSASEARRALEKRTDETFRVVIIEE